MGGPAVIARDGPAHVDLQTGDAFVGREREQAELQRSLEDALTGRGRLVLLAGEPGIGKTRLAQEISALAQELGFRVLWGRCHEDDGAPPFWPWAQILRAQVRSHDTATLRSELGPGAEDVAQIVADLRERFPDLPSPAAMEPAAARFRLFDSVTTFLRNAADREPLVLVLDDLHWADTPSLLLLKFLARELESARLLVLGTYRDVEVGAQHPLSATLAELVREQATRRLVLHGLGDEDLARYIELTAGVTPSTAAVAEIGRETEGNPFFIGEIVRLLIAGGGVERLQAEAAPTIAVPQGVRAVIGRRLDRLSEACHDVLGIAAVIGREFGLKVLGATSELSHNRLLEVLEEAARARLVLEAPGAIGEYRFSHALVRETLYDALPIPQRIRLHRQVGEALERAHATHLDPHLAALAHHFSQAAVAGDAEKAVDYARRAGDHAKAQQAHEVAVTHYQQALQALALADTVDATQHCDLLLALAQAQADAGEEVRSRTTLLQAALLARRCGDAERLARSAIGLWSAGSGWTTPGRFDEETAALLEEALAGLGPEDSALRARALGMLVRVLSWSEMPTLTPKAVQLGREAVAVARRVGHPEILAGTLFSHWLALRGPDHLEERQEITKEWLRVATEAGARDSVADAYIHRIQDDLERGDRAAVEHDIGALSRLAEELRVHVFMTNAVAHQALLAQMAGNFEEEERLAEHLRAFGQRGGGWLVSSMYWAHMFLLRREQGRSLELEAGMREALRRRPANPTSQISLALICAESGRGDDARREMETIAANGFSDIPRDLYFLGNAAMLAVLCACLGDRGRAASVSELLLPYAERCAAMGGAICLGSIAHYLGLLATTLARWEDAERHFEHALKVHAGMGLRPYLAHTRHEYARMLLARGDPGDRRKAFELLRQALGTARELGMKMLLERALPLDPGPQGLAPAETGIPLAGAVFRREGDYWTIVYGGAVCRLRATKGLRYIDQLLRHPGEEFHVLDLVQCCPGGRAQHLGEPRLGTRDVGLEVLDGPAKSAYRRRLTDLRDELEEAERFNDPGRAERARAEIDCITEQLAAAVGLGGRDRLTASAAERARSTVRQAIRTALESIKSELPALGDHLAARIKTGAFCVYRPDAIHPVDWRF